MTVVDGWLPAAGERSMLTSPGWLRAMAGRLGPRPVTAVGPGVTLHGAVLDVPRPAEFFDPWYVFASPAAALPVVRPASDGPAPQRWTPALVLMQPGYECLPTGPGAADPAALDELVAGCLAYGAPTTCFLYTRPADPLVDALRRAGFAEVPLSLTWELHLPGGSMADYEAWLPHKRRIETRRERRLLAEAGVVVAPEPVGDLAELVALRCALAGKYRGGADPAVEEMRLRALLEVGDPLLLTARAGGDLIGFALFSCAADGWDAVSVGYDYADSRHRLAYFGTAFYGAAALAYEEGVRRLGYGQGSYQAKRARGCTGTPLHGWAVSTREDVQTAIRESARTTTLASG